MRVSNTLAFAAGHWRIERVLDDHRSGTQGRFAGQAVLTEPDLPGESLRYLETGELRFGTHVGPATRALRYQGLPDGTVDVRFTYLVLGDDQMEERWRVRGPDKDYQATATLTRWDH
jgi:hypothetical protein